MEEKMSPETLFKKEVDEIASSPSASHNDNRKEEPRNDSIKICPYCKGRNLVKTGLREKKYGEVQLYYCKNCDKKFTPGPDKHKTFPLRLIIDALTLYNRLHSLEESAKLVSQKYGISISRQNLARWLEDYKERSG